MEIYPMKNLSVEIYPHAIMIDIRVKNTTDVK